MLRREHDGAHTDVLGAARFLEGKERVRGSLGFSTSGGVDLDLTCVVEFTCPLIPKWDFSSTSFKSL